ncbi:hypothetical protein [Kluyvera sichuanensis]|uniref:hypothetical protein n=1 Tax=Kluyvera sichuanensis TaxID=2725494 RepID=UPI0034A3D45D
MTINLTDPVNQLTDLRSLILSEIGDFFSGFGCPGEPETPEKMQRELTMRVGRIINDHIVNYPRCEVLVEILKECRIAHDEAQAELQENRKANQAPVKQPSSNSFTNEELEAMAHGNNPQANAYRELLAFRCNSPAAPDGWKEEAEKLAEAYGSAFVIFRHGEEPVCADPTKFWFGFDPAASDFREIVNSSTNNCREITETSTNCPKCGGRGTYHCPQMLGTVECECTLPVATKKVGNKIREDMEMGARVTRHRFRP